jgi:apolipoprotein N-acyltransferase
MLVMRAIENRVSIGRCANTGFSQVVDPFGRTFHRTGLFTRDLVVASLPRRGAPTFYLKHGDLCSKICLAISLCACAYGIATGWRA